MMDKVQALRIFLQLVASAMFAYQTLTAHGKYLSNKTMVSTSSQYLTLLPNLSFVLCARNQYQSAVAKEHGYANFFDFEMGMINEQNQTQGNVTYLNWGGNTNLTLKEMMEKVYDANYTDMDKRNPHLNMSDVFIQPIGNCKKLTGLDEFDSIRVLNFPPKGSNNGYDLFILDPSVSTSCGIDKSSLSGDPIRYTQNGTGFVYYTVTLDFVYRSPLTDPCKHYGGSEETFATQEDCDKEEMSTQSLSEIGCILPWMNMDPSCSNYLPLASVKKSNYVKHLGAYGHKLMAARGCRYQSCPKPCAELLVKSELTYQMLTGKDKLDGRLFLDFAKYANIIVHEIEYTCFHLIVDVGSSLGLWIGLSILGLYDLALDIMIKFKGLRKYQK